MYFSGCWELEDYKHLVDAIFVFQRAVIAEGQWFLVTIFQNDQWEMENSNYKKKKYIKRMGSYLTLMILRKFWQYLLLIKKVIMGKLIRHKQT